MNGYVVRVVLPSDDTVYYLDHKAGAFWEGERGAGRVARGDAQICMVVLEVGVVPYGLSIALALCAGRLVCVSVELYRSI